MTTKPAPEHDVLGDLLGTLTRTLDAVSDLERRAIDALRDELSRALVPDDVASLTNRFLSIDGATRPADEAATGEAAATGPAARIGAVAVPPELRVFMRDVPVRTTQIAGSVPLWAGGAAVSHTLGPFRSRDGRQLWFDFFRIKRLVALYVDGRAEPVLLFSVATTRSPLGGTGGLAVASSTRYALVADSVWIASTLLAADAPAGLYTGLRITGGSITLSAAPKQVADRLTISPQTRVAVSLACVAGDVVGADVTSPYGVDARAAAITLPTHLAFHFGGGSGAIDAIDGDIAWRVYGQPADLRWDRQRRPRFDALLNRVVVPLLASIERCEPRDGRSPFLTIAGSADVAESAWVLPAASINVAQPPPAAGSGGLALRCGPGLSVRWQGLRDGSIALRSPWLLADPGRINVSDLQAGNVFCRQRFRLWKDDLNRFGATVELRYGAVFPFVYNTLADGNEAFLAWTDANAQLDRPVDATGRPFDIASKNSTLIVAVNRAWKLVYLFDDDILFDNLDPTRPKGAVPPPLAIALRNALFKVTAVNGCLLFGTLADDMVAVDKGSIHLTFGLQAYIPTLPDPYAANLGSLKAQFERVTKRETRAVGSVWQWLVCRTQWAPVANGDDDRVDVSFHFAPLDHPFADAAEIARTGSSLQQPFARLFVPEPAPRAVAPPQLPSRRAIPDGQSVWDDRFAFFRDETFALLDVSSNANQMGVSFAWFGDRQALLVRTHEVVTSNELPVQLQGIDVVARSRHVRAFTVPGIAWEPVLNITVPDPGELDPPVPLNYYPDDGGPTRVVNNSATLVPIAPIPLCDRLVQAHDHEPGNVTAAYMTLPFGMRSLAYLKRSDARQAVTPALSLNAPSFANDLAGGIQLKLAAGSGFNDGMDPLFRGFTLQVGNVLDLNGTPTGTSTLGGNVGGIFNRSFFQPPGNLDDQMGVPLTRIDLSGYGASTFSEWHDEGAQFAAVSKAAFSVLVGRTAREVVQVRSIVYPWGIHVVRTVTLLRAGSGYVYRVDSGWKAVSDGLFDFRFDAVGADGVSHPVLPYVVHPGVVRGLFDVQNIRSAVGDVASVTGTMDLAGFYFVDPATKKPKASGKSPPPPVPYELRPVYFEADVALDDVVQGQSAGRVPARNVVGFVQTAPTGIPLTPLVFRALLDRQLGSIGGPLDCVLDIGRSGQKFRVDRIDVNASVDAGGGPVFVAAARGSPVLPKDGSWSQVTHARATGEVTKLPENLSVPLIRVGALDVHMKFPVDALLRIAHPADLLRAPSGDTINFGFLQSTGTQKVLFLTPAFARQATGDTRPGKLLSKTFPLFVDAYRLAGSKGIFPNVGDAVTNLGSAIALSKNFATNALKDGGNAVHELMLINSADGLARLQEDGYKLANAVGNFDLPNTAWNLIDEDGLKIYVEYKASTQDTGSAGRQSRTGSLDLDVDSFAASVGDRWKSRINNMAMVIDLGPFDRLVTIKGNFDARKGAEAGYVGSATDPTDFPAPQLELSDVLEKAKAILQILAALQGGDYVEVFKRGMKIAMSNGGSGADSWQYKFEASQEIPVLKFPPGPFANDPNAPMKIEASLRFGVYFNAALTTAASSDPKKLLPTAGAFVEFYGRMSVMCVSLSIATVYAVGQTNLRISGDTRAGPIVDMKFGFGAQIVIGLPLVGNVSVLYMLGVEVHIEATALDVSAFLLYQGHAELLGGLVGITIGIEAKGSIERIGVGTLDERTVCAAQVTFAIDISIFLVIDIDFSQSWEEERAIA